MTILSETFEYRDGVLYWRNSKRADKTGGPAGSLKNPTKQNPNPYIEVRWLGKSYPAHRLVWELMKGPIPTPYEVDHINGDPSDNRIDNLRLALRHENQRNVGITKANTSGLKGVSLIRASGKYRADIRVSNKTRYLGQFETAEEAHVAYAYAAKKLHKGFYRCECQYCSSRYSLSDA